VLSCAELLDCGLTDNAIARRVAGGRLHRLFPGVYAVGHGAVTPAGRLLAAVKACGPGAVLSHASAAMLLGLLPFEERRPEVTVPHGRGRAPAGILVHRSRTLSTEDVWRHEGVPVTSAARLLLDLAPRLEDLPLRRLMSRAMSLRLTNRRLLAATLDRAGGHRGRGRYTRVLAGHPPPTRSELEDRVHDLVVAGGLPPPDVNVPLVLGGRRVIPDLRWPERRLVVEADGERWHDPVLDAERQALLESHGERVLRVTWAQATAHAHATVRRIATAYTGGPGSGPRASSSASPIAMTTSSLPSGPTSSTPTGSPSGVSPAGTDSAGSPAPLAGSVLRV